MTAGFLLLTAAAPAQNLLLGSIQGWVKDDRGTPQMGAAVAALSPDGVMLKRVFTDHRGSFVLTDLFPGEYALRVTLNRFLPLTENGVKVEAGRSVVLDVGLRGLFSSMQLAYPGRGQVRDMTDDWKWVLRATHTTRPVLRLAPNEDVAETRRVMRKLSGAFSETQGLAKLSGGGGVRSTALANESDLGTSFALATSVFGNNDVTVSGNFGNNIAGDTPTTGFRGSFKRELGFSAPEVSLTVRQLQTSAAAGRALFDPMQGSSSMPSLQTLSLGFRDSTKIGASTELKYGFLYESVRFIDRLDYVSPFAKLTHEITPRRSVELRYSSGAPRPDADSAKQEQLRQSLSALGMFPRVSLLNGRATVQRTEHMEAAYREELGKGLFEAGVYQDLITDAALSALAPGSFFDGANILPDLFSQAATVNGGRHLIRGYRVSYARKVNERIEAALGYGNTGALDYREDGEGKVDAASLRDRLEVDRAHMLTTSLSAKLPGTETSIISSYQWLNRRSAIAADLYNEFASRSNPGLNFFVRQPLPFGAGSGRFEVTADVRNLLEAGYIPIQTQDGRTVYLVQSVRSYRGSLNFVF
ncbi:MAG: hypothetical protein GC160_08450 [Acidobacteria bacterium]|nr:hypothetical protein [Acidobacteriota bacterium]